MGNRVKNMPSREKNMCYWLNYWIGCEKQTFQFLGKNCINWEKYGGVETYIGWKQTLYVSLGENIDNRGKNDLRKWVPTTRKKNLSWGLWSTINSYNFDTIFVKNIFLSKFCFGKPPWNHEQYA